MTIWKEKN